MGRVWRSRLPHRPVRLACTLAPSRQSGVGGLSDTSSPLGTSTDCPPFRFHPPEKAVQAPVVAGQQHQRPFTFHRNLHFLIPQALKSCPGLRNRHPPENPRGGPQSRSLRRINYPQISARRVVNNRPISGCQRNAPLVCSGDDELIASHGPNQDMGVQQDKRCADQSEGAAAGARVSRIPAPCPASCR